MKLPIARGPRSRTASRLVTAAGARTAAPARRGLAIVFVLLVSVATAGCRTLLIEAPLETALLGSKLPDDDARANLVLREYLALSDDRRALRGSARVALEGPDFKLNRPQRILVERPSRLRFEIVGLFDQIAAMLAVDAGRFGFYDASTGEISRGRVTSSLLWDLAKIDLEIPEVVELLLGAPKPGPGLARAGAWLEPEGRIVLVFAATDDTDRVSCEQAADRGFFDTTCFVSADALTAGGELFYFDLAGQLAELRSLDGDGRLRYHVHFENYRSLSDDSAAAAFPNQTTIHSPGADADSGTTARFTWKRVMLADELSDRFFEIRSRTDRM